MKGTRSLSAMSARLPMRCSIIQQASRPPIASPSGRACAVTSRCSALAIELSTASIGGVDCMTRQLGKRLLLLLGRYGRLRLWGSLFGVRFLGFSIASEQLVDAQLEMLGFIDLKRQLWHVAHAHALQQFVADEAPGRSQRLSRLFFLHFSAIPMVLSCPWFHHGNSP